MILLEKPVATIRDHGRDVLRALESDASRRRFADFRTSATKKYQHGALSARI